jgi:D-3-phosphoglycerate dehydrogenase
MASSNRPNILVAESVGFPREAATILEKVGELTLLDLDRNELLDAVRQTEILWVRLRHKIDSGVIAAGEKLKIIATPTTGHTHIDVEAINKKNITLVSLQGEVEFLKNIRATAEHTVALIFTLLRKIPAAVSDVKFGGWDRDQFKGHELYGKVAGIVGYGRLGQIVARYLNAFEMRVLITDPNINAETVEPGVSLVPFEELLNNSDIVTLHMNYTEVNKNYFGKKQFALMREGAWFVNTSRGELTDEGALLQALQTGKLSGAAIDVLSNEQAECQRKNPLLEYARNNDNLVITPHMGGCTFESMEKAEIFLAEKLSGILDDTYFK